MLEVPIHYLLKTLLVQTKKSSQKQNIYKNNLKETQIYPKTNYKIFYHNISMKHHQQIIFSHISKLISIAIVKKYMLTQKVELENITSLI